MYEMLNTVRVTLFTMSLSIAQRTLRFLCSKQNNNNILVLVSACWKYASNNANSPLCYNSAYFRNNYSIETLPHILVCVQKVIRLPGLDNERHNCLFQN